MAVEEKQKISLILTSVDTGVDSLVPSSIWPLAVCKNGGGRPGPIYHVNDVSVCLGRQRGWGGKGPQSKELFSCTHSSFWTRSSTFFALQAFETPVLGAKTTRRDLKLVLSHPPCVHRMSFMWWMRPLWLLYTTCSNCDLCCFCCSGNIVIWYSRRILFSQFMC